MTKFDPQLFFNPVWERISTPDLFSRPPHLQKISTPTSIMTIRSLHIIGCLVFLAKLFRFILYFNPTIVNEKATDRPKWCVLHEYN